MRVGLYGFGPFGRFLYKYLKQYNFDLIISDIEEIVHSDYVKEEDFFNSTFDIIIFCNSINSFEEVIKKINPSFFNDKLIIDVLSVKEYPYEIYQKYNITENILLTHPMFGPNSVDDNQLWENKKFVYYPINIRLHDTYISFMKFISYTKCELLLMNPSEHDKYVAESQFITHFIVKTLKELNLTDTPINTLNYDILLTMIKNIGNDSFELFQGMILKNKYTLKVMNDIIYSIFKIKNMVIPSKNIYSATSIVMNKIKNSENKNIINAAIGVPSWGPDTSFDNSYSLSAGNLELKKELVKFFDNKLTVDNLLITPGGKPALYYCISAYTDVGTSWLVPSPYWVSYPDMIKLVNGNTIILEGDVKNNWLFDLDEVEKYFKMEKVNGIIICNPNNPTGLIYPNNFLDKIVDLSNKYNKKIIADEVYLPLLSANDLDYKDSLYFRKTKNIIAVWSFSKGWGIPGWRVGFAMAHEEVIKKLAGIQSTINTCPPNSSQCVALELIKTKWLPIEDFKKIDYYKNKLTDIFRSKGWIVPDNNITSMYLFPVNHNININEYVDKLFDKGLAIISGEPFGNKNGVRLTIYNDDVTMEKYINIINQV
jgi:aspartate/methionine/tyrosine aminotransferase/prephenate dehydrogenase